MFVLLKKLFNSAVLIAAWFGLSSPNLAQPYEEFTLTEIEQFEAPWALEFLPDDRILLSEMRGALKLLNSNGSLLGDISGVPEVSYGGQGGFGDIVLHPDFDENQMLYLSYAEAGSGGVSGAVVARARLELGASSGELHDVEVI